MENEQEETIIDSTNNEEVVETTEETEKEGEKEPEKPQESPEAKRARLKRQLAQHDKKFGFSDEEKKPEPKKKEVELSLKDTLAIAKADVHDEDIDEVIEYAHMKNVPIATALKDEKLKAALAINNEHRKSADIANTAPARRGNAKVSDDVLIDKANKGDLPESDSEIDRLLKLKQAEKRGK